MSYIQFNEFNNKMAYEFAYHVLDIISEEQLNPVRIRVVFDNDIVYQYMMDGKKGDLWLNRKQKTVEETHESSLHVWLHQDKYPHMIDNESYAVCGGGYPLIINNEFRGTFIVSGLAHQEDHQLILDAIERMKK